MNNPNEIESKGGRRARAVRTRRSLALVAAIGGVAATPAFAAERVQGLFRSGMQVPGMAAGVTFNNFTAYSINNAGQVTFSGAFSGPSVTGTNDSAVWFASTTNDAALVLREGTPVPGVTAAVTLDSLLYPDYRFPFQVLASGKAAVVAPTLSGSTKGSAVLYGTAGGTLAALAVSGQARPGGQGTWGKDFPPALTAYENGRVSVTDSYEYSFSSMWAGSSAAGLGQIVKAGQSVGGITLQIAGVPQTASSGKVTFGGSSFDSIPQADDAKVGFFVANGTAVASLLKYHDPAPGYPAGTLVGNPTGAYTTPAGAFVVSAPTTTSGGAVWKGNLSGGGLTRVFSRADFTAKVAGATDCWLRAPLITPAGRIFVDGRLSGSGITSANDLSLWTGNSAADLKLLLREGAAMPGTTGGNYDGVTRFVNSAGQALLPFRIDSSSGSSNYGLAGYDPSLGLVTLVKAGDVVQIAPNVTRTIRNVGLAYDYTLGVTGSYNDGLPSPLNDLGQVVFLAGFTDFTEAILTTRIPVAGDANYDGIVNAADVGILQSHFNKAGTRADGDFNGDGIVGFRDFQMLELNYGRTPPGVAAGAAVGGEDLAVAARSVPEPGAVGLIAFAILLPLGRRRSRERVG